MVAQRQPGLAGEGGVGSDPEAEHYHVGGHGPAGGLDRPDPAVAVAVEFGGGSLPNLLTRRIPGYLDNPLRQNMWPITAPWGR